MASIHRLLFALPAIVVATGTAPTPRPTLKEWKDKKQGEADADVAVAARESKMAAVNKAVELLETLQAQVMKEGEDEVATYNKFACFCKDTTSDKLESIKNGEDEKASLIGNMGTLMTHRDGLDGKVQQLLDDIKALEKEMKEATEERQSTLKLYETNAADLRAALDALEGAIKTLKGSKRPSLVQLQSVSETLQTAAVLADALGLGNEATKSAMAFLQQPENKVQMEDYKFHSDGIIKTLEGLLADFKKEKISVDEAEVKSVAAYDKLMQDKTHAKKMKNQELDESRKAKAKAQEEIAATNEQLSTVEATLLDDKDYTNTLSKMCSDKAKTWDQRSRVRADELATLTQAIGVIKGAVKDNTSAKTIRFAQQAISVRLAKSVASNTVAMDAIEAEAEAADAGAALVQTAMQRGMLRASVRQHAPSDGGRDLVIDLLKSQGVHLKSTMLTALASKLAKDPFAKIKVLIQEMIEKLLQEESEEANQKGFCDKATADAEQKRDYAAEELKSLNGEMAKLEATRDRLWEELDILADDIDKLVSDRTEAQKDRDDEKKENEATVDEADQGLSALNMCIDVLDKFYKTIKKEKVDLSLVQGPEDDAPDAGFDNGEAYTGAQGEAGGILGMLDVMKSDFERTISETELAEEKAQQDHLAFMTQTGKSLAEKTEAEGQKEAQNSDTESKLSDADDSFVEQGKIMRGAITELLDLKPQCVDTGMSYNDRVANREDEIASLKKALCILGNYAEFGPDGAAKGC